MNAMPLHPAIVHVPLGLSIVIPAIAVLLAGLLWSGRTTRWVWLALVLTQAVMVGGTWAALETGEGEEDRVEKIVSKQLIEQHEHSAKRLLAAASVTLVTMLAVGLLPTGTAFRVGTIITVAATVGVMVLALRAGHSGGELVYIHGAASAYQTGTPLPPIQKHDDRHHKE